MIILDWYFDHSLIGTFYDTFQIIPGSIHFRGIGTYFANGIEEWHENRNQYTLYPHKEHLFSELREFQHVAYT